MSNIEYTIPEEILKNTIMANLPENVKIKSIHVKLKPKSKDKTEDKTVKEVKEGPEGPELQ